MTSLPGQRRSIAYPSHDSSLRTRPKGRAARLNPAGGDKSANCFLGVFFFSGTATELMRDGCSNNARGKTTHHVVKIHWHKINRQQQSSVYRSFKQTGHYTQYSNRGRRNNSFLSAVFGCWLRHGVQVIREKLVTSYIPERKQGYKHMQRAATGRRSTGRDRAGHQDYQESK